MFFKSHKLLFFVPLILISAFIPLMANRQYGITRKKTTTEITYEGFLRDKYYECSKKHHDIYECLATNINNRIANTLLNDDAREVFNELEDKFYNIDPRQQFNKSTEIKT